MAKALRIALFVWPFITLLVIWMAVTEVAGSVPTTLTCDRARDSCELSGGSYAKVPRPSQLAGAVLGARYSDRDGDAFYVTLVRKDGTRQSIGPQDAFSNEAIASYRTSVSAIDAFAKDPAQPHLSSTFVYKATLLQKIRAISVLLGTLGILAVLIYLWRTGRIPKRARVTAAS